MLNQPTHTVAPLTESESKLLGKAAAAALLAKHGGQHPDWSDQRSPLSTITRIVISRRIQGDPSLDDWFQGLLMTLGYGSAA